MSYFIASGKAVAVKLPEKSQNLIEEALKMFSNFCLSIVNGKVLFQQMKDLHCQMESTNGKAMCIEEYYNSGLRETVYEFPDYEKLMSALRLRMLEYNACTERTVKLEHLARLCTKVAPGILCEVYVCCIIGASVSTDGKCMQPILCAGVNIIMLGVSWHTVVFSQICLTIDVCCCAEYSRYFV